MKRNNLAVLALVCLVGIGSGCRTMENIGIALHESIDAALSNKIDQLPAVTNMIPVTVKPDAAQGCGCDLSGPTADQFTGAYLESRGNTEEAPSGTYGLRLQLRRAQGRDWNVGSLIPKAVDDLGKREVRVKCFDNGDYRYHVLGATAHEKHDPEIKLKAGDTVTHPGGRFWVVYESRRIK